jgi:Exostosin family
MNKTVNVFITSCEIAEGAWNVHEQKLEQLHELSDKKYSLTDDPALADIILIGNVREENWGRKILENKLINKYPNKCFSLSDQDAPLILNRGIYASGTKSILNLGRVRTGSFTIYADWHLNPHVKIHTPSAQNVYEKKYFLSFIGRNSHPTRDILFNLKFQRKDILIEDSSSTFDLWAEENPDGKRDRFKYYNDTLLSSKFCLCPRGCGAGSLRLFESMRLGIAPVIISDEWLFPKGPKWPEFSIVIKSNQIKNIENILQPYEKDYKEMGYLASKAFQDFFAEEVYFNYIVENCVDLINKQWIPEGVYWKLNPLILYMLKLQARILAIGGRLRGSVAKRMNSNKLP